ncbi:MAG: 2-hydroxyacid dehydrogenase [Planctomycetaceae bacterium]
MRIAVFSSQPYDRRFLDSAASDANAVEFVHFEAGLTRDSVVISQGCDAICCFVNDQVDREVLSALAGLGIRLVLLRCAGFNNVDLQAAAEFDIVVMRVPEYSPHAVAEHTVALTLCLIRQIHRAWSRVREGDFRLSGLLGFDIHEKTVGVIGTGRIGTCVVNIFRGFGCRVLACDKYPNPELVDAGVEYVEMPELLKQSRIVTLHCPLTIETTHLINRHTISLMQPGGIIVNTSRGGLIDTRSLIHGLKTQHVRGVALDVYEEEASLFFTDHSEQAIPDDVFARLLTFPNVLITGHQGFFTSEALTRIAETTVANAQSFRDGNWVAANVVRA